MTAASTVRTGRVYAEVVATTNSAWFLVTGASGITGIALDGAGCQKASVYTVTCTSNSSGNWANSRLGVLVDYGAKNVTFYRNGVNVFTSTGIDFSQPYSILVIDRDSPVNSATRTYTLYNTSGSQLYPPSNIKSF
jgi:hypothetical protein